MSAVAPHSGAKVDHLPQLRADEGVCPHNRRSAGTRDGFGRGRDGKRGPLGRGSGRLPPRTDMRGVTTPHRIALQRAGTRVEARRDHKWG